MQTMLILDSVRCYMYTLMAKKYQAAPKWRAELQLRALVKCLAMWERDFFAGLWVSVQKQML